MKKIISLYICAAILLTFIMPVYAHASENEIKRESTFDYPMLGDPNYISDEDFFGAWNNTTNTWIRQPYFNYSRYPGLSAVENAAKDGRYEDAEYELLEYYRGVRYDRVPGATSVTNQFIEVSELLGKNFYFVQYNGSVIDNFTVENDWKDIEFDVKSSISSAAGKENYRTFMINSIDRTSTAEFMTKEGGCGAVLKLKINNTTTVEIEATRDTYISSAENSNKNYGNENVMLASERAMSLGEDKAYVWESGINRPYITFDISSLKATDIINSATLVIRGRNASGTGEKECMLYQYNDSKWEEDTLCWDSFTEHYTFSCHEDDAWDFDTSSNTKVKGKICFLHRGAVTNIVAATYDYTKKEDYAYTFLRQEMALINSIGDASTGVKTSVMNSLDMSNHIDTLSRNVYQVIGSKYMTPEVFTAILKQLWLMARWEAEEYFGLSTNNWGSFATLSVYDVVARFKELAVYDEWLEMVREENHRLNGLFALEDGTCVELTNGYTDTLFNTLYKPIRVASQTDTEFPYTEYDTQQIRKMVRAFCYTMAPGFKSFNWGDDTTYTKTSVYDQANQWYNYTELRDMPELEYFATKGESMNSPDFNSITMPNGLRTVMRSDWTDKAVALNISAKGVGSHWHYDQLSVAMYAYGKFLLTDQGYGAVLTGDVRAKMMSSPSHNLVTMNNKSLASGKDGECLGNEMTDLYDFASYSTPLCQDADTQERSVLYDKKQKLFIISDYIRPKNKENPQTYQQYWHMLPSANISIDDDTCVARSHFDDINVEVTPVGAEDFVKADLEEATFSGDAGSFQEMKKAVYHKEAVGDVTYDVVVVPENIGEDFSTQTAKIDTGLPAGAANSFSYRLINNKTGDYTNSYYYHLNDLTQKRDVTLGRYKTDASTLYITEDKQGNVQSVFLMDGTYIEDSSINDKVLLKSEQPIASISFRPNGQTFEILSTNIDNDNIENTTFYNYNKIQGVIVNGTPVKAKTADGGYIYFGAKPIFEGTSEVKPSSNPDVSGGGGGGGAHAASSRGNDVSAKETPLPSATPTPDTEPYPSVQPTNIPELEIPEEIKGHWAEKEISELFKNGIISGDNGLRLSDNITRAEFVTVMTRAMNLKLTDILSGFADVLSDDWYAPYVYTAMNNGLVDGQDGVFRPNDNITREEMCKIIVSAMNSDIEANRDFIFDDDEDIGEWAREYVYKAYSAGIIYGMENGVFSPKSNAQRAQAFAVMSRFIKYTQNED
ncbi:MAG: S-layer homology domain-containing protein [Clostridia bacterium]